MATGRGLNNARAYRGFSLVELLVKLSGELDIDDGSIAGHRDVSPGKTTCPGALEHYICDGTLLKHVRAARVGQSFSFEEKPYNAGLLR